MKVEQGNGTDRRIRRTYVMDGCFAAAYAVLGALFYRVYLRQAIHYPGRLGFYDSDLPVHISEGVNHTAYSLMERTFGFLRGTLRLNQKPIAVVLALVTLGVIFVTWRLLVRLMPEGNAAVLHLIAFACMFTMPIYLPSLNPFHYMGMQSGTVWHNSTYLGMKLAGTIVLLLYYRYQERYRGGLRVSEWVLFAAALILVNLMKPNFILCFAPAMAILLLADCIADRGRTFGRQVLFGIPVLISLVVVAFEAKVLFDGENSGASIIVALPYGLLHWNRHPIAALIQSVAFPLVILAGTWRELGRDRVYRATWLIWLTGLLEYLMLSEDGPRRTHGNLSWGYSYCVFLVFVVCACRLYRELRAYIGRCKAAGITAPGAWLRSLRTATWQERGRALYLLLASALFLWHLSCGLAFSWMTYQGGSYLEGAV